MNTPHWSLLIHNIPPKPAYLRNKVANRLAGMGAIALKNSVYVLPNSPEAREGFMWLAREVETGGGKAFVGEATFPGENDWIQAAFVAARQRDYEPLLAEAETMMTTPETLNEETIKHLARDIDTLRKKSEELQRIDFFRAPGGTLLAEKLAALNARLTGHTESPTPLNPMDYTSKTWVTRAGVFVDRIASAWLIRRFIDPEARFRFVDAWEHQPETNEVRFDMPIGEFTHQGEACTFEVMIQRFALTTPALTHLAGIIHDIDMNVSPPVHPESRGIELLLTAIARSSDDDHERLSRGGALLDDMATGLTPASKAAAMVSSDGYSGRWRSSSSGTGME